MLLAMRLLFYPFDARPEAGKRHRKLVYRVTSSLLKRSQFAARRCCGSSHGAQPCCGPRLA
jgi:hypothetical protein